MSSSFVADFVTVTFRFSNGQTRIRDPCQHLLTDSAETLAENPVQPARSQTQLTTQPIYSTAQPTTGLRSSTHGTSGSPSAPAGIPPIRSRPPREPIQSETPSINPDDRNCRTAPIRSQGSAGSIHPALGVLQERDHGIRGWLEQLRSGDPLHYRGTAFSKRPHRSCRPSPMRLAGATGQRWNALLTRKKASPPLSVPSGWNTFCEKSNKAREPGTSAQIS